VPQKTFSKHVSFHKNFLQACVPAGDISGARGGKAGTTLSFTCPVLFTFFKVLFGFAAWTLNRSSLGTPKLLF